MKSKAAQIEAFAAFQGVERELVQGLLASARLSQHPKGSIFLKQGQPVTRFYGILEGWCGAFKSNRDGQESILQIFSYGEVLPEPAPVSLFANNTVNLQALTDLHLVALAPNLIRDAIDQSKAFAANMLAVAQKRCNDLRNHIEQLTLYNAEYRVGRFLLDVHLMMNTNRDIVLPFDKLLIASYLGIKPETLSRTLQTFKEQGFSIDRNHVQLPHTYALCDYCDAAMAENCPRAHLEECPVHAVKDAVAS